MQLLLQKQSSLRVQQSCSSACSTSYPPQQAGRGAPRNRRRHSCCAQNGKTEASEIDAWTSWQDAPHVPNIHSTESTEELANALATKQEELDAQYAWQRKQDWVEGNPERVFLVGADIKRSGNKGIAYTLAESLEELGRLAGTAGLQVVGRASQKLAALNPQTYLGPGKLTELMQLAKSAGAETVIFDDELSPRQLRALEKSLGQDMRVCDRTMLILDIFSQRAASREGQLQVALAQLQYQLPRLTRMWSHLERQAGGKSRGMGEKQLEVDKRLMRTRIGQLQDQIEEVRRQRSAHRTRRAQMQLPVVALVGYTNSGKSTLLNRLTAAGILAEDQLFATLDPTTRRLDMPSSTEVLMSDTVGFIQKLPTQLVAAFRATLEEIREASLILHVVDISHPGAAAQSQAVIEVLEGLHVDHVPISTVWNKIDSAAAPEAVRKVAGERPNTLAISARTGANVPDLLLHIEDRLAGGMSSIQCLVPYAKAELLGEVRRWGSIQKEDHAPEGTLLQARVPEHLADKMRDLGLDDADFRARRLALMPALAGTKPW